MKLRAAPAIPGNPSLRQEAGPFVPVANQNFSSYRINMDQVEAVSAPFPTEPILQAIRSGQSVAVQLPPGGSLFPEDIAAALDVSKVRFLVASKPHDLVSFSDQISSGAAQDGKAGQNDAFKVLTSVDAKSKSVVLVITDANTLSSEATLQFLGNAMAMQRRLSVVLIAHGALADIVASNAFTPVRKRFVLLSGQPAADAPDATDVPAAPAAAAVQVIQTEPARQGGSERLSPSNISIGVSAVALAVAAAVLVFWHKPDPRQAGVSQPAAPRHAAGLASALAAPPRKPAGVAVAGRPAMARAAILPQRVIALPVRQPDVVKLPSGTFRMGSMFDGSEAPVHAVSVPSFAITASAVTVQAWSACVGAGACKPAGQGAPDMPVTDVSWDEANQYAAWLSAVSGMRYRLPTEAEWEYAARAGASTRYAWGDAMPAGEAACNGCNSPGHAARPPIVTAFAANKFGLYGMGGGVAEWVGDCWHKNYDGAPASAPKAWDAPGCSLRVLRGGSWQSKAADIRPASRDSYDASVRYPTHGFRLVRAGLAVSSNTMPGKS